MNTKLYKRVLNLAGDLVHAAQRKDQKKFDALIENYVHSAL